MHLNEAQTIIMGYYGKEPVFHYYRAPHALRGTPAKPHFKRSQRMVFSKASDGMIPVRRLFKGHRL